MLKRCFAIFFIVCLVFSLSVLPCFANNAVSDYELALYWSPATFPSHEASSPVYVTSSGVTSIIEFTSTNPFKGMPLYCHSNYYAPKDYDRTVFCSIGLTVNSPHEAWFSNVNEYKNKGSVTYVDCRDSGGDGTAQLHTLENAVGNAEVIYPIMATWGESFAVQITVPAYSVAMEFDTSDFVTFGCSRYGSSDMAYTLTSWGAFVIDTADDVILDVVKQILQNTSDLSVNFGNVVLAVNDILGELRAIGADTSTIVTLLNGLTDLSERQLNTLENVASNVEAIYYFLTEELKDHADATDQVVSSTASQIQNQHMAEEFYMTNMDSEYKKLQLDQVSLSGVSGGLSLVSALFQDVWNVIGKWQIVYTFPLTLGIALLVIGRISKSERKESTSEKPSAARHTTYNPHHNNDSGGGRNG